ncbi:MAG TPA: hypothetical protein VGQ96_05850, partial [Candidatus Eremiobacteraceae bacterium]|nr:hypothetical protein [Candidatus Eremiobacteraceae bacterium]
MNRVVASLFAIVILLASWLPASAASNQPFFQGFWRCAGGGTLNVTPSFGPWLSYRSTFGSDVAQSYLYHDMAGG